MALRNQPAVIGVIGEAVSGVAAVPHLHGIKNVKDAMMVIRPTIAELENTINSRRVGDLWSISSKMVASASALLAAASVLREIKNDNDDMLAEMQRSGEKTP